MSYSRSSYLIKNEIKSEYLTEMSERWSIFIVTSGYFLYVCAQKFMFAPPQIHVDKKIRCPGCQIDPA